MLSGDNPLLEEATPHLSIWELRPLVPFPTGQACALLRRLRLVGLMQSDACAYLNACLFKHVCPEGLAFQSWLAQVAKPTQPANEGLGVGRGSHPS